MVRITLVFLTKISANFLNLW